MKTVRVTWQEPFTSKKGQRMPWKGYVTRSHTVSIPDGMDPRSFEGMTLIDSILKKETDWGRDNCFSSWQVVKSTKDG